MMHVGEDDILLDNSIRYAERLEREGGTVHLHTWAGMMHVFPSNLAILQAANEALDNIGDFLKQQLSGDAQATDDIANAVSFLAGQDGGRAAGRHETGRWHRRCTEHVASG